MLRIFCTILLILSLSSCASSAKLADPLVQRLNNRGPVALSPDNPFLAANLLVSREIERSPEVKGFVEHKGGPRALEVTKESFEPLILRFYYPESHEFFTLEEMDESWLITGPAAIPQDKMRTVAALTRNFEGEPKLGSEAARPAPHATAAPLAPPTSTSEDAPSSTPPTNALQQIIDSEPGVKAELTSRGDLVHFVSFSGETLSLISRWYTGDRDNAGRIARINEIKNPAALSIGDQVVIPSYVLKNTKRLTEPALKRLSQLAASEH